MDELQNRLSKCFWTVFPTLPAAQIPVASADTVPEWDSVAHLTLLAIIGEEFEVELDLEECQERTSFHSIQSYLSTLIRHG